MQKTYKAIARAAGYYAWQSTTFPHEGQWEWMDKNGWSDESSDWYYPTEEAAYKDCCLKCGLITEE